MAKDTKLEYPETLKYWRLKRGYTQQEVADAAGITRQGYAYREKHGNERVLRKIAKLFRVKVADLID